MDGYALDDVANNAIECVTDMASSILVDSTATAVEHLQGELRQERDSANEARIYISTDMTFYGDQGNAGRHAPPRSQHCNFMMENHYFFLL